MNNAHSNHSKQDQSNFDLSDDAKDQCLLYLLNELQPDQIATFEKKLSGSQQLADELERQAEIVVMLSQTPEGSSLTCTPQHSGDINTSTANPKQPIKLASLALAVCIALLIFGSFWSPKESNPPKNASIDQTAGSTSEKYSALSTATESRLIARAWAAGQLENETSIFGEVSEMDSDTYFGNSLNDEFELQEAEITNTSTDSFSWMFTATSETQKMETNDG